MSADCGLRIAAPAPALPATHEPFTTLYQAGDLVYEFGWHPVEQMLRTLGARNDLPVRRVTQSAIVDRVGYGQQDPLADFFYTQDSKKVFIRLDWQPGGKFGLSIDSEDGAHEQGLIAEDMVRLGIAIQRAAERVIEGRAAS